MRKILGVGAFLIFPIVGVGYCVAAAGFDALELGVGARAVALGGAYSSLSGDSDSMLYNPASLGSARQTQLQFTHNQHFEGVSQEAFSAVLSDGYGLAVNILDSGSVSRTTISNPDGTGLSSTGLTNYSFLAGFGRIIGRGISVGGSMRYVRESIDGITGQSQSLDVGGRLLPSSIPGAAIGLAVQGLGPRMRYSYRKEDLPTRVRLGGSYLLAMAGLPLLTCAEVTGALNEGSEVGLGAEIQFTRSMAARLGFNTRNDAGLGLATGLGWRYERVGMDYSVAPGGVLGITHRLSLSYFFGELKFAADPEA